MDNLTKKQRSFAMSRVKSKWTAPEKAIHGLLKSRKIRHLMHPKMKGSPDLVLKGDKVAVFIHGCFWHKCPTCYHGPRSRKSYWKLKVERNVRRDRNNERLLRKIGWKTVRLWGHEIGGNSVKNVDKILGRVE